MTRPHPKLAHSPKGFKLDGKLINSRYIDVHIRQPHTIILNGKHAIKMRINNTEHKGKFSDLTLDYQEAAALNNLLSDLRKYGGYTPCISDQVIRITSNCAGICFDLANPIDVAA